MFISMSNSEDFNHEIDRVCEDVFLRDDIKKGRTVTLKVTITPDLGEENECPMVSWEVDSRIPKVVGPTTRAIMKNGQVCVSFVQDDSRQSDIVEFAAPNRGE